MHGRLRAGSGPRGRDPAVPFSSMMRNSIASSVPQSLSRTMTSWATSTRRRVRYPESAVRSAVSARPLRAPCVEMKYSRTDRPSRKLALIGRSRISPFGFAIRPRIPASWRTCLMLPRAPDWAIMKIGLNLSKFAAIASPTSSVARVQTSTIWRCRSSLVMRPRSYCCSIFSTSPSAFAMISPFASGTAAS